MFFFASEYEPRHNRAAVKIQCAFRKFLARRVARDYYRSQYRKLFDLDTEKFVYQNKTTLAIRTRKPRFFKRADMPNLQPLEAPLNYNPGNEVTGQGYAMIISNTQFPLGKWSNQIRKEVENDYEVLKTTLAHEFIGKIRVENMLSIKNPSTLEVFAQFDKMRKMCRTDGFLVIYISTHIITINHRDSGKSNIQFKPKKIEDEDDGTTKKNEEKPIINPIKGKEKNFFAFKNSIWSNTRELMETSISLKDLAYAINQIKCASKVILLNYAHVTPPKKTLFQASKQLYPHSNILERLSNLCQCPVVAACAVGFRLRDYLRGYPFTIDWREIHREKQQHKESKTTIKERMLKLQREELTRQNTARKRSRQLSRDQKRRKDADTFLSENPSTQHESGGSGKHTQTLKQKRKKKKRNSWWRFLWNIFTRNNSSDHQRMKSINSNHTNNTANKKKRPSLHKNNSHSSLRRVSDVTLPSFDGSVADEQETIEQDSLRLKPSIFLFSSQYKHDPVRAAGNSMYYSTHWEQMIAMFNLPTLPEIFKSPRPELPMPTWSLVNKAIKVELPDAKERRTYLRKLIYWRCKRTLAQPVNLYQRVARYYQRVNQRAPKQMSYILEGHSLFGKAVIDAIRGGASHQDKDIVTVKDLFACITVNIEQIMERINNKTGKKQTDKSEIDDQQSVDSKNKENKKGNNQNNAVNTSINPNSYSRKNKKRENGDDKDNNSVADSLSKGNADGNTQNTNSNSSTASYKPKTLQTPVLYLPSTLPGNSTVLAKRRFVSHAQLQEHFLSSPVSYRIGPPAAPEKPYVIAIAGNTVTLEWYNPPFDGISPTKYKIFMRNVTRNFSTWEEIYYPGEITSSRFTIKHLPLGISCQFQVTAWNHGGWSLPSEPTVYVTPGEDLAVLPTNLRLQRLQQSGIIGVLDRMKCYPHHRHEQLQGISMLLGFIQSQSTVKSTRYALGIAEHLLRVIKIFALDVELLAAAFHLLGWCFALPKAERRVRALSLNEGLLDILADKISIFRDNAKVVNAILWLRKYLGKYLQPIGEFKYKVLFPQESEEDVEEEDNDLFNENEEDENEKMTLETSGLQEAGSLQRTDSLTSASMKSAVDLTSLFSMPQSLT